MQVEVFLHEEHVDDAEDGNLQGDCEDGWAGNDPCAARSLHGHIDERHRDMRDVELVRHELVEVLAVRQGDVLVKHQAVQDGEAAVYTIDDEERQPCDVVRRDDEIADSKENDERYRHGTGVTGKTQRPAAEVAEAEHQVGKDGDDDEVAHGHVQASGVLQQGYQCGNERHKTIAARDAVDAVHEVVDIHRTRADDEPEEYEEDIVAAGGTGSHQGELEQHQQHADELQR